MALKLWHCAGSRSIRPLWTLEEMGLDYDIEVMKFPPRFVHPGYTDINPIGTVPFFTDGEVEMTESAGISQYLVDRHGPTELGVGVDEPDYGLYLNWLHRSDATLTFPQTLVLRYTILEPEESVCPLLPRTMPNGFTPDCAPWRMPPRTVSFSVPAALPLLILRWATPFI